MRGSDERIRDDEETPTPTLFGTTLCRYLCALFTPPVFGALFRAALVANYLRGAFPPVDLRAVCLVRAMFFSKITEKVRNTSVM